VTAKDEQQKRHSARPVASRCLGPSHTRLPIGPRSTIVAIAMRHKERRRPVAWQQRARYQADAGATRGSSALRRTPGLLRSATRFAATVAPVAEAMHRAVQVRRDGRRLGRIARRQDSSLRHLRGEGLGWGSEPPVPWTRLSRASGGVGCELRQRRGEEALHRVEWLDALVCSAQDEGALESCEQYGGIVLCG
jgi:hypothetical protein